MKLQMWRNLRIRGLSSGEVLELLKKCDLFLFLNLFLYIKKDNRQVLTLKRRQVYI